MRTAEGEESPLEEREERRQQRRLTLRGISRFSGKPPRAPGRFSASPSPSPPSSHRPKPNQTSGHWAIAPQPPQDGRRTDEADEADVPYFGCGKLLREDSEVE